MVRRMYSSSIVENDNFLSLPKSAQNLYFFIMLNADDDGFVSNPKMVTRAVDADQDDLQRLIDEDYLILFDDGVVAVKDWLIHNTIRKDRYKKTVHQEDAKKIEVAENGSYQPVTAFKSDGIPTVNRELDNVETNGKPNKAESGNQMETQVKLSKDKLSKDNNILSDSKTNSDHTSKNKSKNQEIEKEFETLWQHYPKKAGKPQALSHYKAWRKKSTKNTYDVMRDKLKNYLEYLKIKQITPEYTLNGSTWFNGRFDDELDMSRPTTKNNQKAVKRGTDWSNKQVLVQPNSAASAMSDEEMNAIFQGSGGQ